MGIGFDLYIYTYLVIYIVRIDQKTGWWFQILFYFHPENLGKINKPILTSIFFKMGWFNHQLEKHVNGFNENLKKLHERSN